MTKSLVSFVLAFIFTFTQSMAFVPNQDQIELGDQLDLVQSQLNEKTAIMTSRKFQRLKKKMLIWIKKEQKRIAGLSSAKQTEVALDKLQKRQNRLIKIVNFSSANEKRIKRVARSKGMTFEEVKAQINNLIQPQKLKEAKKELITKIQEYGSYLALLASIKEEISRTTYEMVSQRTFNSNKNFRKPAQLVLAFGFLVLFILIIPILAFVLTILFFILGGVTGGVGWFVGGVVVGTFLVSWLLYILVDAREPERAM
ncbi:hypothetical protein N9N67_03870 [Bacteriovoracaceae bacterium]|nr:hypothetical protein [Bacteriovoracaceae bacterium]